MSVISLSRRIEKLEADRRAGDDVAAMSDKELVACLDELQGQIGVMIEGMGGKEAAMVTMRAAGALPLDLKVIEEWTPSWPQ